MRRKSGIILKQGKSADPLEKQNRDENGTACIVLPFFSSVNSGERGGKALRTGQAACRKEMTNMTFLKQKTSKVTH